MKNKTRKKASWITRQLAKGIIAVLEEVWRNTELEVTKSGVNLRFRKEF
jgi:hypothetical protein